MDKKVCPEVLFGLGLDGVFFAFIFGSLVSVFVKLNLFACIFLCVT